MSNWGKGEIISAKPITLGETPTTCMQVELAPAGEAGKTTMTMEREILDRFTTSQVHGGFSNLGFETEADRKRKAREAGAAGLETEQ